MHVFTRTRPLRVVVSITGQSVQLLQHASRACCTKFDSLALFVFCVIAQLWYLKMLQKTKMMGRKRMDYEVGDPVRTDRPKKTSTLVVENDCPTTMERRYKQLTKKLYNNHKYGM